MTRYGSKITSMGEIKHNHSMVMYDEDTKNNVSFYKLAAKVRGIHVNIISHENIVFLVE